LITSLRARGSHNTLGLRATTHGNPPTFQFAHTSASPRENPCSLMRSVNGGVPDLTLNRPPPQAGGSSWSRAYD